MVSGGALGADRNLAAGIAACVVVTYGPDLQALGRLVSVLSAEGGVVIVVDNTEDGERAVEVRTVCEAAKVHYKWLGRNAGIARAQNVGIEAASQLGADLALLLDQDTKVSPQLVPRLIEGLLEQRVLDPRVAAVGPESYDHRDGKGLVAGVGRWGPSLRLGYATAGSTASVPFLISAGTLLHIPSWREIGPFREDYFIDHVDYEWGVRATLMGYRLVVIGGLLMAHELAKVVRSPSGRLVRQHGHRVRRYYQARNYVLLQRDLPLPFSWRVGLALELLRGLATALMRPPGRIQNLRYAIRGLADGIRNRRGPMGMAHGCACSD